MVWPFVSQSQAFCEPKSSLVQCSPCRLFRSYSTGVGRLRYAY